MGVVDLSALAGNAPVAQGRNRSSNNDRPQAKVWLNIGYQAGDAFISLPIGLPLDTMEAVEVRGQNPEWIKQQNARNQLLKLLQQAGTELAPGEEKDVQLTIRIRRTKEQLEVASEDNEYMLSSDLLKSIVG